LREQSGWTATRSACFPTLLELLGDITGCQVLDAGCGAGYLTRVLAARQARVTGIDVSPRLIDLARGKDPAGDIDYRVADPTRPVPGIAGRFDAAASYLVLNDVPDYFMLLAFRK
jgi:2-polyprenyl-3-methyl-5-hydroxy-6-metoxy-1,4-benzoquinol methylase